MKKALKYIVLIPALCMLMVTGCVRISAIVNPVSPEDFEKACEAKGLTITDYSSEETNLVAKDEDGNILIQLYVYTSAETAETAYTSVAESMDEKASENDMSTEENGEDYHTARSIRSDEEFHVLARIDNSVIYGYSYTEENNEILMNLIKELGYWK